MPPRVRFWLVELPVTIAEILMAWYRLFIAVFFLIAGPGISVMVLITLVLWYGFGIRWGW